MNNDNINEVEDDSSNELNDDSFNEVEDDSSSELNDDSFNEVEDDSSNEPDINQNLNSEKSKDKKTKNSLSQFGHLDLLLDIKMDLVVEIGKTHIKIDEVLNLGLGSIVELNKTAEEQIDVMVNGKLIAKGELVSIDENFGVRIVDIIEVKERLKLHENL